MDNPSSHYQDRYITLHVRVGPEPTDRDVIAQLIEDTLKDRVEVDWYQIEGRNTKTGKFTK